MNGSQLTFDKLDLMSTYPQYKNKKDIELQRYKLCPIDVQSEHLGQKITMKEEAADSLIRQIIGTPLMFADTSAGLPKKHKDENGKRTVIGSAVGGGKFTDEQGVSWVYGDYLVYNDVEAEIYKTLVNNKSKVGVSYEIYPTVDEHGNVHDVDFRGTSIIDTNHTAFRNTELLVADATNGIEIKYDDVMKQVLGAGYQTKLDEYEIKLKELNDSLTGKDDIHKAEIEEKEAMIIELEETNTRLRERNTEFINLIKK